MEGDPQLFIFLHDAAFLFEAGAGAFHGLVEVGHRDELATFASGQQGSFVDEIR